MRKTKITTTLCLILSLAGAALAQDRGGALDLVAKMPADNVAAAKQIAAEIVKLGPGAIKEIAAKVVETGRGNDAKVRFALNGLAHHVSRPGAEDERAMYAKAILESLAEPRPADVREFLIGMLQRAGRDESVPALAKFLTNESSGDPAARALCAIGTKSAGEALTAALPDAGEANRASILRALGDIRFAPATRQILAYAKATDPVTRAMALYALANIGAPEAVEILSTSMAEAQSRYERSQIVSLYLLLAQRLAEAGQKDEAVRMCRELIKGRNAPSEAHVVSGALATLVKALGPEALDDLLKALEVEDKAIRVAALELTNSLPGDRVTGLLAGKLEQVDFERRVEIVHALAKRQDEKSWEAVVGRLKDEDKLVRLAAVEAVSRRANDEALNALLPTIRRADAEEGKAISEALQRIPGDAAMAAVAKAITDAPPAGRVALLETLAGRRARRQVDAVVAATRDGEATVRMAAIKALRDVGSTETLPRMLDLVLNTKDDKEQAELMQSVVAVSLRNNDARKRAEPMLAALARSSGAARRTLLRSLPQIGGDAALEAVVKETASNDKEMKDATVRALADWKDAPAAPHLLKIAEGDAGADDTNRVLALRGYLRLAGVQDKRPVAETVEMYRKGLAAARRADEKRLAISGLSGVRHVDALKLVAEYAGDEEVGAEAALAALRIVTPQNRSQQPLRGDQVNATLEKIAASVKDEATREKITAHLKGSPGKKE
jgi:HEAT repeat protein